ncbi:hypothetical protein [Xenorhabdus sp. TS4]|uniref:hypothetical protein n=1 Tax=Xenorhabdus sp. TS4 TaxID=1873483 RepID=UPI001656D42D|nr:hypothetical protein [Xenorhabdus sp. TS4]MBC8948206.1 hypothetical protein [Xenorhabdus sp. TS4]
MPFNQPFREKVALDDIIYGLDGARIKYTGMENGPFTLVELSRIKYKVRPHTIDEFVVQGEREAIYPTYNAAKEVKTFLSGQLHIIP